MADDVERLRRFVAAAPWTFARTMPDAQHWYTVRGQTDAADFERFVVHIRTHGYRARFGNASYTYFDLDGYTYWTMGAPLEDTVIINRKSGPGGDPAH